MLAFSTRCPHRSLMLVISLPLLLGSVVLAAPMPDAVSGWIAEHAHALDTTDDRSDLSDLAFLKELIGDARVVNAGEVTHGTHEIQQFRHRLFRFLVEEMGYRLLALEMSAGGVATIDRYISGSGDASTALDMLTEHRLGMLLTPSGVELVEWMRSYNQEAPLEERIHVVGLDMQSPFASLDYVYGFLRRAAPEFSEDLIRLTECLRPYEYCAWQYQEDALAFSDGDPVDLSSCGSSLVSLLAWLESNESDLTRATSRWESLQALHCMQTIVQWDAYLTQFDPTTTFSMRDQYMALNAAFFLDAVEQDVGMLCWSHNGHAGLEGRGFGTALQTELGDKLVTILTTFQEGESLQYFFGRNEAPATFGSVASRTDCLESALATVDVPVYMIDLRCLEPGSEVYRWFDQNLRMRLVGAQAEPIRSGNTMSNWRTGSVVDNTDLVVYLKQVTAPTQFYADVPARAEIPVFDALQNGSFEAGIEQWTYIAMYPDQYTLASAPLRGRTGAAVELASAVGTSGGSAAIQQAISLSDYAGQRVRVSAWLRATDIEGWTSLWFEFGPPSNFLEGSDYLDLFESSVSGTTGWVKQEFELDVRSYDPELYIGVVLLGTGSVLIDDVRIEPLDP